MPPEQPRRPPRAPTNSARLAEAAEPPGRVTQLGAAGSGPAAAQPPRRGRVSRPRPPPARALPRAKTLARLAGEKARRVGAGNEGGEKAGPPKRRHWRAPCAGAVYRTTSGKEGNANAEPIPKDRPGMMGAAPQPFQRAPVNPARKEGRHPISSPPPIRPGTPSAVPGDNYCLRGCPLGHMVPRPGLRTGAVQAEEQACALSARGVGALHLCQLRS